MKKLLLSLALVLGMTSVASAAPVTVDFSKATGEPSKSSATPIDATIDGIPFSFVFSKLSGYEGKNYLMMYGKDTSGKQQEASLSFTYTEPVEKITIHNTANASKKITVQLSANGTAIGEPLLMSELDKDYTFSIPAASQAAGTVYKIATTNANNCQLTSLTINGDGTVTPPAPEPTTVEVANIKAFLDANNTTDDLKITGATTAVYQNGRYLWIKDATGVLLTYNTSDVDVPKYVSGQTVEGGITGKYVNYSKGQYQMGNLVAGTFKAGEVGFPVEPEIMQVEEVAADLVNTYILLKGVKVAAGEKENNYVVSDASNKIALFNQFADTRYYDYVEVPTGENLNVYAMIGIYNGNIQLYPVKVTTESGYEVVAAPTFSVASGEVAEGTEVAIACATEGAKIYYTTDGTNPTAASTLYSAPIAINEAMTIKAIAVKDGMVDSSVATAEYTIKVVDPNQKLVTFNFADPSTLNPAYSEADTEADGTTGNKKIDLTNGDLFKAGPITISTVANGNPTRLYLQTKNNDWTFRFFKNSTVTLTAADGCTIEKVEFETQTSNYATALGKCTFEGGTYADKVLTANAGATSVTITNPKDGGATIGLTGLTVYYAGEYQGVAGIEADENAPVEYYNLQGVRVAEPANGLYIRRQGNKVTKVLVK